MMEISGHIIRTERYTARLSVAELVRYYRRADLFLSLCSECKQYGKRYGCPPFDYDVEALLLRYSSARIIGVKITPEESALPLSLAQTLMAPVIDSLMEELLAEEKLSGGLSFGFAGGCRLCGMQPCARQTGEPCRHPDRVRPSLEAYGFDLSKAAHDLLKCPIQWGKDGLMPEYLMVICGIFTNPKA